MKSKKHQISRTILKAVQLGIEKERMRTDEWLKYAPIDPVAVCEGIKSGKNVNAKVRHEMSIKLWERHDLQDLKISVLKSLLPSAK